MCDAQAKLGAVGGTITRSRQPFQNIFIERVNNGFIIRHNRVFVSGNEVSETFVAHKYDHVSPIVDQCLRIDSIDD